MKSGCYQHKRSGVRIHSSTIIKKHLFTVKVLKDKNRTKGTENWPILKQKKSATKSSSNFVRSFEFLSNFILRCFIVAQSNCCPRLYEERKRERVLVGKREEEREAERVTRWESEFVCVVEGRVPEKTKLQSTYWGHSLPVRKLVFFRLK